MTDHLTLCYSLNDKFAITDRIKKRGINHIVNELNIKDVAAASGGDRLGHKCLEVMLSIFHRHLS